MQYTIVLHRGILPLKVTRIVMFILGCITLTLWGLKMYEDQSMMFAPQAVMGIVFLGLSIFGLSEKSRFSPKVKVTDAYILLKDGFWSGSKKINWSDIQHIKLGAYKVTFRQNGQSYTFKYDTTAEVSLDIKNTIRQAAKQKGIEVSGG